MSEIARKRFGLLQNISYLSKGYFTDKFNNENFIGCTYENFDIQEIDSFTEILKNNADLKGLSVTIPTNKPYSLYINYQKKAALIGAVNTIKITKKGKLKGYNTDYYGFKKALEPLLQPHHKRP
jgi:shikimate dehydrogenase